MHKLAKAAILSFLAIGLHADPQQVQNAKTSGWLEYHDTTYGLSFRYPSSMRVREDTQRSQLENPYGHIQKVVLLETKESEITLFFPKGLGSRPSKLKEKAAGVGDPAPLMDTGLWNASPVAVHRAI